MPDYNRKPTIVERIQMDWQHGFFHSRIKYWGVFASMWLIAIAIWYWGIA